MVALLIGIAVSAVWMGALLPAWRQQTTREKEAELVFRGEAYARAIALFFVKNQTLPPNLDVLVQQHYLRQKYKDPITNKDFLPVGGAQMLTLGRGLGGAAGQPSASAPGRGTVPPVPGQGVSVTPVAPTAGIFGVRSTSTETSIRVYQGQTTYSQFPFDYQVALQRMGVRQGGPAGPLSQPARRGGVPLGRGSEQPPGAPTRGRGPGMFTPGSGPAGRGLTPGPNAPPGGSPQGARVGGPR